VRILVGGAIGAVLCILLKTQVYLSAGNIVAPAINGEGNWYDFILKMFFLLLMSKVGYKTGFLPQNIAIGGAFGGTVALLLGANPAIGVAAGMVGFVGGVTCCPIAALALACDMFKFDGMGFVLWILFAGVGTLCGGFHGYYSTKKAPVPEKTEEEKLQEKIAEVFDKK
jgi:H+/Cl- antiporter ClcA